MKKLKKITMCLVVILLHTQITGQTLVDQFNYIEVDTNSTVSLGLWKNTAPNNYSIKLVGGETTGSINGFQIQDGFVYGTNTTLVEIRRNAGVIIEVVFSINNISDVSQINMRLNKETCPTTQPCTGFFAGDDDIRLTWSNDGTGPIDVSAPIVPSTYTWNSTNNSALVTALGFPNGKIYQSDYKSSDRVNPAVSDTEIILTNGTTQTVFIGDPLVSNKRTPMVLTIDTNASIVIQAVPGVGINTDTPQVELEVNGIIKSTIRDQNGIERECNGTTKGSVGYDATEDKFKGCYNDGWHEIQRVP